MLVVDSFQLFPFGQNNTLNCPTKYYNIGTITQTGNTVKVNGGAFTEDLVGGVLVYGGTSGQPLPVMVVEYVSASELLVAGDALDLPDELPYTIWYGGFSADAYGNMSYKNLVPAGNKLVSSGTVASYTAHDGGGQANATEITTQYANVNSSANSGDSVKLPADALIGTAIRIINNTIASIDVFPPSGGNINSAPTNTAASQSTATAITFVKFTDTNWIKM